MAQPTIAILGASGDRSKFGNKAVRAYVRQGYRVFPINPNADQVAGVPAFHSLQDVPVERLDRISVYLPPAVTAKMLDQIAAKGCNELWLNPGSASPEIVERATELGLNVVQACSILDISEIPTDE